MVSSPPLQRYLMDEIDNAAVEGGVLNPYTAAGFITWYCFLVVCCGVPIICLSIRFFCKRCSVDEDNELIIRSEELDRELSQIEANVNLFSEIEKCRKKIRLSQVLKQGTEVVCVENGNSNQSNDSDDVPGYQMSMECLICLGNYEMGDEVIRSPSCKHMFHKQCILEWLSSRQATECPCCRQSFVKGELDMVANEMAIHEQVSQQRADFALGNSVMAEQYPLHQADLALDNSDMPEHPQHQADLALKISDTPEQYLQHQADLALSNSDVQEQDLEHGLDSVVNHTAIQEPRPTNPLPLHSEAENLTPLSVGEDKLDP